MYREYKGSGKEIQNMSRKLMGNKGSVKEDKGISPGLKHLTKAQPGTRYLLKDQGMRGDGGMGLQP